MTLLRELQNKRIGRSGLEIVGGVDQDEHIAALRGPQAARTFDRMRRSDYKIIELIWAVVGPILAGTWGIEAAGEDQKDIDAAALMKQILFTDLDWNKTLNESTQCFTHGHSVFEPIHENKINNFGTYTGLATLGYRKQSTLEEWNHDKDTGKLISIRQVTTGDIAVDVKIPAEKLMIFYHGQEGDNHGFPMLRPLYGPYERKKIKLELGVIGVEKFAIPIPIIKVPANIKPEDEEYLACEEMLQDYAGGEKSYLMIPEGWDFDLKNSDFDPDKSNKDIKAEDERLARAWLAAFLELGLGGNGGSYSLGSDLSDFFLSVLNSIAKVIVETFNKELIPNLCVLNFGDSLKVFPTMTVSDISDKAGKELMEIITGYIGKSALEIDEPMMDFIRKRHNFPKKAEGELLDNKEKSKEIDDKDKSKEIDDDEKKKAKEDEETKKLSEKNKKTPHDLINQGESKLHKILQTHIKRMGKNHANKIADKFKIKGNADAYKVGAIEGQKELRLALEIEMTNIALKSYGMALREIGNPEGIKLNEDKKKLTKNVRAKVEEQSSSIAAAKSQDTQDRVTFTFSALESQGAKQSLMKSQMVESSNDFAASASVKTTAQNASAVIVNDTRNDTFFDPNIIPIIESFTYMNEDPKVDVCVFLKGQTIKATDAEIQFRVSPFHHNCKTWMRANLFTTENRPAPTAFPTLSKTVKKSITLKAKDI